MLDDPQAQVHYCTKALLKAFNIAIPDPDPIIHAELTVLLQAHNQAWHCAVADPHNVTLWDDFEAKALSFKDHLHCVKTAEWHSFASTLSYSTDPAHVT